MPEIEQIYKDYNEIKSAVLDMRFVNNEALKEVAKIVLLKLKIYKTHKDCSLFKNLYDIIHRELFARGIDTSFIKND